MILPKEGTTIKSRTTNPNQNQQPIQIQSTKMQKAHQHPIIDITHPNKFHHSTVNLNGKKVQTLHSPNTSTLNPKEL